MIGVGPDRNDGCSIADGACTPMIGLRGLGCFVDTGARVEGEGLSPMHTVLLLRSETGRMRIVFAAVVANQSVRFDASRGKYL